MIHVQELTSAFGRPEVVEPRRMTRRVWLTMAFVLVGLAVSVWALTDTFDRGGAVELPVLEVPKVQGLTIDEARRELEADGFAVEAMFQPNELQPKGAVIGQRPLAGSKLEQGELVVVIASDGPLGMTVPNVKAQMSRDALAVMQASGLRAELIPTPDENVRVDEVIGSEPEAGSRIPTDGVIKVLVSSGPAPRVVPPLLLRPLETSLADLGRSGLGVGKITRVYRPDVPAGLVLEANPAEGSPLPRDTPVALVVSAPPPTAVVPFLVGLQRPSAEKVAEASDVRVQVVILPVLPGDPTAGRVVGQGTPPLAKVPPGSLVEITVATEQAPAIAPISPGGSSESVAPANNTTTVPEGTAGR